MELFRHCYMYNELNNGSHPFMQDLNNFGFCLRDGTPFNPGEITPGDRVSFRWKFDSNNKNYMTFNTIYNIDTYHHFFSTNSYRTNLEASTITFSDNSAIRLGCAIYADTNYQGSGLFYYTSPLHCIYIPLKNKGFYTFFGINSPQGSTTGGDNISNYTILPSALKSFTATPTLYGTAGMTDAGRGIEQEPNGACLAAHYLGVPSSKGKWTYFYGNPWYKENQNYDPGMSATNNPRKFIGTKIDYGNSFVSTGWPYLSGWTMDVPTPTYTNINQNVCSLIKVPYNGSYIDGVYLLATAPREMKHCTFFSFNGRNFLNLIGNYVFELTSS